MSRGLWGVMSVGALAGCLMTTSVARPPEERDVPPVTSDRGHDAVRPADVVAFDSAVGLDVAPRPDAPADAAYDAGIDAPRDTFDDARPTGAVACAGTTCAAGEDCCLATGRCFNPVTAPSECPRPPQAPGAVRRLCASNAHCAPTEFCLADNPSLCIGPGACTPRWYSVGCGGDCRVCGCDGVTYATQEAAHAAGVRTVSFGACGRGTQYLDTGIVRDQTCGATTTHCPEGNECCPITGRCYDPIGCAGCCRFPPPGTRISCRSNDHCAGFMEYCFIATCDGLGGCIRRDHLGDCSGELNPVCGCNGRSYLNACFAARAGTGVASTGACRAP